MYADRVLRFAELDSFHQQFDAEADGCAVGQVFEWTTLECLLVGRCTIWSLLWVFLYTSVAYSIGSHVLFWYNFFTVWNIIARDRRVSQNAAGLSSHSYKHERRRVFSIKEALKFIVSSECMSSGTTCCICMSDFYENELVTQCEECGKWFHKQCLFEWLDRSDSCPCCRSNMVAPPQSCGLFADLSKFLGFDPRRRRIASPSSS